MKATEQDFNLEKRGLIIGFLLKKPWNTRGSCIAVGAVMTVWRIVHLFVTTTHWEEFHEIWLISTNTTSV